MASIAAAMMVMPFPMPYVSADQFPASCAPDIVVSGASAVNQSNVPNPRTMVATSTSERIRSSRPPSSKYSNSNAPVASGYQKIQMTSGQEPKVSLVVSAP